MITLGGRINVVGSIIFENQDDTYLFPETNGFDILNAKYENNNVLVSALYFKLDISVFLNDNSTKLFTIVTSGAGATNQIREYTISTPGDLKTISFTNKYTLPGEPTSSARSLFFSSDGYHLYTAQTKKIVLHYTMSTPWDLSTASLNESKTFSDLYDNNLSNRAVFVNTSGTKLFLAESFGDNTISNNNTIRQYTLSDPWSLSASSYDGVDYKYANPHSSNEIKNIAFSPDGLKMFVSYFTQNRYEVKQVNLTSPYNLVSANTVVPILSTSNIIYYPYENTPESLERVRYLFYNGKILLRTFAYSYSPAFGISSVKTTRYTRRKIFLKSELGLTGTVYQRDAGITENGQYGYVLYSKGYSHGGYLVRMFKLLKRNDVESMVYYSTGNYSSSSAVLNFYACQISPDGKYLFLLYDYGGAFRIARYETTTPFNFSSVTNVLSPSIGFSTYAFYIRNSKIYFIRSSDGKIYEYNLPSNWDISSFTFVNSVALPSTITSIESKLSFSHNGTKLFITNDNSNEDNHTQITEFNLSTPWDITTVSSATGKFIPMGLQKCISTTYINNITFSNNGRYIHYVQASVNGDCCFFTSRLNTNYSLDSILN